MTTNSLALLREVYGAEAGRAIGLWTAGTTLATLAGPPGGGALVEWVSWRWIFLINIPLAVAAVVLALAGRCPQRDAAERRPARCPGRGARGRRPRLPHATHSSRAASTASAASGGHCSWARPRWSRSSRWSAARAEPLVPPELLRSRNLDAREPRDAARVRSARRDARLPAHLPAVPRLQPIRGRPGHAADRRAADPAGDARGRPRRPARAADAPRRRAGAARHRDARPRLRSTTRATTGRSASPG